MKKLVVLFAALATALALAVPAGAGGPNSRIGIDGLDATEVVVEAFGIQGYEDRPAPRYLDGRSVDIGNAPAPRLDEELRVFIQLDIPSVAELVGDRRAKGQATTKGQKNSQLKKVKAQQASFRASLESYDLTEQWSLQYGANGLVVDAKLLDLLQIQNLPGVISVAPLTVHTVSNETSVPWIGAPDVWPGGDGSGVSIAIIDTGIDYYHLNFGGSGDAADYENDDPKIIEDDPSPTFPTAKVVGGHDFVGDNYNASSSDPAVNTPNPDPDPLDCHGHGSHVGGTAAGLGTTDIGPGVAKGANLYALKVFGCAGSTNVTSQAIEWVIQHNVDNPDATIDVINMSLGSDFGSPFDPSAIASNNAAAAGIVVVASAGNAGNVPYITGSPAVASDVISVAASIDDGFFVLGIEATIDGEPQPLIEAAEGAVGTVSLDDGDVSGPLEIAEPLLACSPLSNDLAGKIALIQRGSCSFTTKYRNAQNAGAAAVVVYNHSGAPIVMGDDGTGDDVTIPGVMISTTDGEDLNSAITGGASVGVKLSSSLVIPKPELADQITGFSSLGPGGGGTTFKPDIAAPGFGIFSTNAGTGGGGTFSSGTSMAAPHVAGAAALLRQQYPSMSADSIKSLLMNSSVPAADSSTIPKQGVGIMRVNAASALGAYTTPAGVSFGRVNPINGGSISESVMVTNMDAVAKTYDISVAPGQTMSGVSVSAPAQVTVPANGSASFDITLSFNPAAMPFDNGFQSQSEIDGRVWLTNGESLAIGYMAAIDPASDVSSEPTKSKGRINRLSVENASSTVGWIDTFTLVGEGVGAASAVGVRANPDLGTVEFGVAASSSWESQSARETDIYIDTNQDGSYEYVLVAADLGLLLGGDPNGQVVTALFDLVNGGGFLEWFVIGDYNDTVQTLLVDRHGPFGFLPITDTTFDILVLTFDFRFGLDGIAVGSVDLKPEPGNEGNLAGFLFPGASGTLKVTPADRGTLLITYQNNQVGDQWQIIQLKPN